jgi:hypothetical protein
MATRYAQVDIVRAESGSSVHGLYAYINRAAEVDPITGQAFDFRHQADARPVAAAGTIGPGGREVADPSAAWDAASKLEMTFDRQTKSWRVKKGNGGEGTAPQIAKHHVVAIPLEFSDSEKLEFARDYAKSLSDENNSLCSFAVHLDDGNPHVHIIESIRPFEQALDGSYKFGKKPRVQFSKNVLIDKDLPQERFVEFTEKWSAERGLRIQWNERKSTIDPEIQAALSGDFDTVSKKLLERQATFTLRDLDKASRAMGGGLADFETLRESADLIEIEEGRFTTRSLIQERAAFLDGVQKMAGSTVAVDSELAAKISDSLTFRDDQKAAFDHVLKASQIAIVQGDPGTGKSHMLRGAAQYHRSTGNGRIIALGPTNKVKAALAADLGADRARTLHAELFKFDRKTGQFVEKQTDWKSGDLVIIDEAAMIDDRRMSALIRESQRTGAKLVLVGDDKQLRAIERGGLYSEMRAEIGDARLTEITRQKDAGDRAASTALAAGRFREAIQHYDQKGAISVSENADDQRAKLVKDWAAGDTSNSFIYAGTNKNVDALNIEAQRIRQERGELGEARKLKLFGDKEQQLFERDQVQIRVNNREQDYMNGHVGRVAGFSAAGVRVQLEDGREVTAPASHLQIGYAGTTYRGQGATNRAAFVLHEAATADRALSLVALTRHKEQLKIYVDKTVTKGTRTLARQMSADRSSERNIGRFDLAKYDAARAAKPKHKAEAPTPPRSAPPQASAPATPAPAPTPTPANDERARRAEIQKRLDNLDKIERDKKAELDAIAKRFPRLTPDRLDELRKPKISSLRKLDSQIEAKSGFIKSMLNKAELADLKAERAALADSLQQQKIADNKSKKEWFACEKQYEAATTELKQLQHKHGPIRAAYTRAAKYIGADAVAEKIWAYFAEGREGRTRATDLKSISYPQAAAVLERDRDHMTDAERDELRQTSGLDRAENRESLRAELAQSAARFNQQKIEERTQAEAEKNGYSSGRRPR